MENIQKNVVLINILFFYSDIIHTPKCIHRNLWCSDSLPLFIKFLGKKVCNMGSSQHNKEVLSLTINFAASWGLEQHSEAPLHPDTASWVNSLSIFRSHLKQTRMRRDCYMLFQKRSPRILLSIETTLDIMSSYKCRQIRMGLKGALICDVAFVL